MRIDKTLQIGEFHTNHCEDFLITSQIGSHLELIAVMDGCTMGEESAFASMLFGKTLRNIAKQQFYQEFVNATATDPVNLMKEVVKQLQKELKHIKNQLGLNINELLSTLLLGIIDTQNHSAEVLVLGDGLVCYNGQLIEFEQGDKPDYLAYHLSEDFEEWYSQQKQRLSLSSIKDLSISTDGIFTFKNLMNKSKQLPEQEIIHTLLINGPDASGINFLDKKVRDLKEEANHVVTDDLAIIRVCSSS